jgi:iron complex outermembrane receptor protein
MISVGQSMRRVLALVLGVGVVVPSPGWAQAAKAKKEAPAGAVEIEEITVTAQKREENVQEIPVSVTAITGSMLKEKGVTTVNDLTETVPNLTISQSNMGASSLYFSMRGTVQNNPSTEYNPTVGLYVDGVYVKGILGANFDLEDLDRVEVLRGPQGTLYGRNTVGGTVNLINKKPTEERSITVATEVGNYDAFKGRLTLNVPLIGKQGFFASDAIGTVSLRENAMYESHEGYVTNETPPNIPGAPKASGGASFDNLNRVFNTLALRWQPRKDITVDYSYEYHRYREAPRAYQLSYVYPNSLGEGLTIAPGLSTGDLRPYVQKNRVQSMGNNAILSNDLQHTTRFNDDGNNRMHILTGSWDLGEVGPLGVVTVKSISGYRQITTEGNPDLDGSPLHVAEFRRKVNLSHWSEELQWVGTAPRVHYVLGAYYYGEHSTQVDTQVFLAIPPSVVNNPFLALVNNYAINGTKNDSWGPFAQASWTPPVLGDRMTITGGLRYNEDHIHQTRDFRDLNSPANSFFGSIGKGYGGSDAITYTGNIDYQWTDNLMTYFRASKGYQAGLANGAATTASTFTTVNPEKLQQYEAGFKSQWFDNRLRLNADGFYSDYTDLMVAVVAPDPVTHAFASQVKNAGKTRIWGSEVEAVAVPFRGVELTGNYAYLNAKYTEFIDQLVGSDGRGLVDAEGNPVIGNAAPQRPTQTTPESTFTIGVSYTAPPTTSGTFSVHMETYYQGSEYFGFTPKDKGWAYALVNGRIQFVDIPLDKGSLDVAVFGRNLFDRKYRSYGIDFSAALGWAGNNYGPPRTFGLGLTYHFTAS